LNEQDGRRESVMLKRLKGNDLPQRTQRKIKKERKEREKGEINHPG
jgi:hypothetical protein